MLEEKSLKTSIVKFACLLRSLDIRVSTSEVIDVFNALSEADIMDKEEFKYSLKGTLLKDNEKEEIFEEAFEYFFQLPESKFEMTQDRNAKIKEKEAQLEEATEDLQFRGDPFDLDENLKLTYANMDEKYKEQIRDVLEQTEHGKNVDDNFRPIIENMVRSSLNRWEDNLRDNLPTDMTQDMEDEELDTIRDKINNSGIGSKSASSSVRISQKDLKELSEKDLPKARQVMYSLIKRLMNRISRRYKRTSKMARLDMRKTIRQNISHGGTMFNISYKEKRKSKPSLLVICDVSGSMARYTSFLLQFLYGLGSAVRKIEGFIFSEDLERITEWLKQKTSFEKSISELVNQSEEWGRATDLGASLQTLEEKWDYVLRSDTTVIILSDGLSSGLKRGKSKLRDLNKKVKNIIWLNPIPSEQWEQLPQIEAFREQVDMFECNTLQDLEKVLKEEIFVV